MRSTCIGEKEEGEKIEEGVWELLVLLQRFPDLVSGCQREDRRSELYIHLLPTYG